MCSGMYRTIPNSSQRKTKGKSNGKMVLVRLSILLKVIFIPLLFPIPDKLLCQAYASRLPCHFELIDSYSCRIRAKNKIYLFLCVLPRAIFMGHELYISNKRLFCFRATHTQFPLRSGVCVCVCLCFLAFTSHMFMSPTILFHSAVMNAVFRNQ